MSSVYVVTTQHDVIEYSAPGRIWLRLNHTGYEHLVFYCTCRCTLAEIAASHNHTHEKTLSLVSKANIISIGFGPPAFALEHVLSPKEWRALRRLTEWLLAKQLKGKLPKKLDLSPLRLIVGDHP